MSVKNTARTLCYTDRHPTMQKYAKLAKFADELGIFLSFYGGRCIINDRDRDESLPTLYLEDIEGDEVCTFPYDFEYKMIYDNPAYIEERRKEAEECNRKRREEEAIKAAEAAAKKAVEERLKAEEIERSEKALLADLKKKYES